MQVTRFHPITGAKRTFEIPGLTQAAVQNWMMGGLPIIQAMPDVAAQDRDTFLTGLLPSERHELTFGQPRSVMPTTPVGGTPVAQRLAA